MENDVQIKELIESFVEYRNLLTPVEQNLRNFASTYDNMRTDIQELSHSFDGSIQKKLDAIYNDLSKQFEKSKDLSSQIESFKQKTDKFGEKLSNLVQIFENFGNKMQKLEEIEKRATDQIDKLDVIVEQKKKMYNLKDLEKNLESYNVNVQKINDYINKDIAVALKNNNEKIGSIKDKSESVLETLLDEKSNINQLIEQYSETNRLLKNITEKQDVNQQYIFDLIDACAQERGVKTKKWGVYDAKRCKKSSVFNML